MGRRSTIDDATVFAAVARQLVEAGGTTLQAIVEETGVSVGSLYHRYESREGLLARAWLDAALEFQRYFLAALQGDAADAGEQAALATPRFCRVERIRAVLLACCRRSEFLSETTPEPLRAQIESVNDGLAAEIGRFARESGHAIEACRLAIVAIPLGAVRLYLPNRPVPRKLDDYVREAYRAVMRVDRAQRTS